MANATSASIYLLVGIGTLLENRQLLGQSLTPAAVPDSNPYTRYLSPNACEQAVIRLRRKYWRDLSDDTLPYAVASDSVPPTVVTAARQCSARFDVRTVPEWELRSLGALSLWGRQRERADSALRRLVQLNASRSARARGWIVYGIITPSVGGPSPPTDIVRSYLHVLDGYGPSASVWRLLAHTRAAERALAYNDAERAEQEGRAAIRAMWEGSVADQIDWVTSVFIAYRTWAKATAVRELLVHGDADKAHQSVAALFDSGSVKLGPIVGQGSAGRQQARSAFAAQAPAFDLLGARPAPVVQATAWYGAVDHAYVPRPGHVTLLVFANPSCGSGCYPTYMTLRRLLAHQSLVGAEAPPLDLVILTQTHGYFRQTLTPDPTAEGDSTQRYFRDFLNFPAPVAVETTHFTYRPDGRRVNDETVNQQGYGRGRNAVLIDQNGTIRWVDDLTPANEATWWALIGQLREPRGAGVPFKAVGVLHE